MICLKIKVTAGILDLFLINFFHIQLLILFYNNMLMLDYSNNNNNIIPFIEKQFYKLWQLVNSVVGLRKKNYLETELYRLLLLHVIV